MTTQEYIELYKDAAMEQMSRYGIPASITLAQGLLESARGSSQLFQRSNNMFGIKASASWLDAGGRFVLASDDRPNEKFCSYDSPEDSMEHHSRFLKENNRYAECFELSPDDYKGWSEGLTRAGYATDPAYAAKLQKIIESNGLAKYDTQVMFSGRATSPAPRMSQHPSYAFPVMCEDMLIVTQPFGVSRAAEDPTRKIVSQSMTLRTNGKEAQATENGAKVIAVNADRGEVTVQLRTGDGGTLLMSYSGVSSISVAQGDILSAGQRIGTTGKELSLSLRTELADGASRPLDPAWYMRQLSEKGSMRRELLYNGLDLLSAERTSAEQMRSANPTDLIDKLLGSSDYGLADSELSGNGSVVSLIVSVFAALLALSSANRAGTDEERRAIISQSVADGNVDLRTLVPGSEECRLKVCPDGKAYLQAKVGQDVYDHQLTQKDIIAIGNPLSNNALSDECQLQYTGKVCTGILLQDKLSHSFEQAMSQMRGSSLRNDMSMSL